MRHFRHSSSIHETFFHCAHFLRLRRQNMQGSWESPLSRNSPLYGSSPPVRWTSARAAARALRQTLRTLRRIKEDGLLYYSTKGARSVFATSTIRIPRDESCTPHGSFQPGTIFAMTAMTLKKMMRITLNAAATASRPSHLVDNLDGSRIPLGRDDEDRQRQTRRKSSLSMAGKSS